jgi:hypothetical protein
LNEARKAVLRTDWHQALEHSRVALTALPGNPKDWPDLFATLPGDSALPGNHKDRPDDDSSPA